MKKIFLALFFTLWTSIGHAADCTPDNLVSDLATNSNLANAINRDPGLVDSWQQFSHHGVRTNPDFLEKYNTLTPSLQDELADLYKNIRVAKNADGTTNTGRVNFEVTKDIDGQPVTLRYDENGFPDFRPFSPGDDYVFRSDGLVGDSPDMTAANQWLGSRGFTDVETYGNGTVDILNDAGQWIRHTWHHHQDGRSMVLIPSNIHNSDTGFSHSGGAAVIRRNLQGFFDELIF